MPNPVAATSTARVSGRSSAGIVGSNPSGAWMSLPYECCVLSGRSLCVGLITRPEGTTECGVRECDRESSIMRRPLPTGGCCMMKNIVTPFSKHILRLSK